MKGVFPIFETSRLREGCPSAPNRLTPPALACESPKLKSSSARHWLFCHLKEKDSWLSCSISEWPGCMVIVTRAKLGSRSWQHGGRSDVKVRMFLMRFFSDAKKASLPLLVHLRCLKVNQNFMIAIKSKESEFNLPTSPANCTHPVSRIYEFEWTLHI